MSAYQIQTAGWPNIEHLQNLSANALRNSALTNAILSDPKGGHVNNIQSRMILAYDVYEQALTSQASSQSTSKVLKAVNTRKLMPRIQACAWLEWVFPDPKLDGQWNDDLGAELVVPPYVNRKVYQYVENTKHSHRKTLMRGKAHYLIRALDCEPNIEGMTAAREILSRIHSMDSQYDIVVQTKIEHEGIYRDLGWQAVGDVLFKVAPSATGDQYRLRTFLRPGTGKPIIAENPSAENVTLAEKSVR